MKKIILLSISFVMLSSFSWGQADYIKGWNWSITTGGRIGIYHTDNDEDYTAHVTVSTGSKQYNAHVDIQALEWGFLEFPADFEFSHEDMPDLSGTIEAKLIIEVGSELVCQENYRFTARNVNQPYEVKVEEIEGLINLYGDIVDDCIFWSDTKGFNYVIRSHNEEKGIYLAHWLMDVSGATEQISYYRSSNECGKELIQRHSIGWDLKDADEDGYMEFYSLIVDGCVDNWQHPTSATLVVYTNESKLELKGNTYSLLEDGSDAGGHYKPSVQLEERPLLLMAAEAAWEVYIME